MSTLDHAQMNAVTGILFYLNKNIVPNQGNIIFRGWFENLSTGGSQGGIEFDRELGQYVFNLGDDER
jgi:hypothetical protein